MQISITTRHCNVPKKVRTDAEERLQRLQRFEPRLHNALVEFDKDHAQKLVETHIFLTGSRSIIAHGEGETFRTALDQSLDRLTRQLKRRRERVREHKAPKLSEAIESRRLTVRENTDD